MSLLPPIVLSQEEHADLLVQITAAENEVERLRRVLQFYASATAADFANDNGFNAEAALAR